MNDNDPIEEFFARERGAIEPLPGQDERWTEIVAAARARRRPSRAWVGYAAAAAAALVAGAGGWMLRGILPGDTTTPPLASSTRSEPRTVPTSPAPSTSPGASQTPDMTASGSGAPSSAASSNPTNLPVPQDFTLMSMSFAGDDTILGIGSGTCSGPA